MSTVEVRWFDGYLEVFSNVTEVRFGGYLLWIKMQNKQNRHIPLSQVRWYAVYPESHGLIPKVGEQN